MLRQLRTAGGGLTSSAAVAAAAAQALRDTAMRESLAVAAAACGNLRLLRHLSADASPSGSGSGSSSSSPSVAEDPRWKSPFFDSLLSLAARATSSSSSQATTPSSTPSSTSAAPTSSSPPLPPPIRSVVSTPHGLLDFIYDGFRATQALGMASLIRSNFETSFDEAEFLEGAADARHAVFDALSEEGDLNLLRGAVAPGLLRALHGLKEMHAAAGLAVRMTAVEDGDSAAGAAASPFSSTSTTPTSTSTSTSTKVKAELGLSSVLTQQLFDAMSAAVPGSERDDTSSIDRPTIGDALEAIKARGVSDVFAGQYQIATVRFSGSVLVQTFAKSSSSSPSSAAKEEGKEGEEEEKENANVAASSSSSPAPPSKSTTTAKKPTKPKLTLVRELLDKRPHLWWFVRGPLPEGLPARQLGLPWMLLSIS